MSLDQEYDRDLAAMWRDLEEQVVAAANRGVVPGTFHPTQCCLNNQTDNLRFPLAVVEGKFLFVLFIYIYKNTHRFSTVIILNCHHSLVSQSPL